MTTKSLTLAGYAVVVTAMVAVQVAAVRGAKVATIGAVLRSVMRTRLGRWVVVAAWLWLGWHLFVRVHRS